MIVRPADAIDVARVIALARDTGLELAVRGGSHSAAGHGVSDGGVVLDLRDMRSLAIDLEQRTSRAEGGLTAGEYTRAAGAHGLAAGFGDTGSVGIGGITLSGGIGFLVRKHGLTIDDLLAADVVTADGELVRANARAAPRPVRPLPRIGHPLADMVRPMPYPDIYGPEDEDERRSPRSARTTHQDRRARDHDRGRQARARAVGRIDRELGPTPRCWPISSTAAWISSRGCCS